MTFLSKRRGGVRITFDDSFVLESRLQASVQFPGYPGAKDLAPYVYYQTNLVDKTRISYLQDQVLILQVDTLWLDLWVEYDSMLEFAGTQMAVFPTPVSVTLVAPPTDPQLFDFGTREYSLTVTQAKNDPTNYFVAAAVPPIGGVSPVTATPTEKLVYATGFFKTPLIKGRLLKIRDIKGYMPSGYTALYYLGVKYPPSNAAKAPFVIITSSPSTIKVYASPTDLSGLTLCTGTLSGGFVLPMGTKLFRIYNTLPKDTYDAWLEGAQTGDYPNATALFEDLTLLTEDDGNWAPYFYGKNLAFIPTPYHILTDST